MKRRTSKKSITPNKSTTPKKKSSATKKPPKTSNSTAKSTPVKTRSRSRTLPKSPISETSKQSKINDFYKPISPSFRLSQTPSSEGMSLTADMAIIHSEITIKKTDKPKKGPKIIAPIFGSQKRYSLRKLNDSVKKLKFDINEQNCSSNDHNSCANQLFVEPMQIPDTNDSHHSAEDLPKVGRNEINVKQICDQNLDKMMNGLKIKDKSPKNKMAVLESSVNKNTSDIDLMCGTNGTKLCERKINFDEDLDLMPVPLFKIPDIPKTKKSSKENAIKYVDKEKEKKLNYFLKNLSRIKRDKEMLNIQSIEDMENELKEVKPEETPLISETRIKPFEGIAVFCDYIPKAIENNSIKDLNEISSNELTILDKLPLNRLLRLIPVINRSLKDSDRQQIISYILDSISTEESPINFSKSEDKIIEILFENDSEIYLSFILNDFYRILSRISNKLRISEPNECQIQTDFNCLSNVIRIMSHILSKSTFKIEAIDSVKEFIKLLIICFALGLDYRLIQNNDYMNELKNLIAVILNNLLVDELKAVPIIESLISFCLEHKSNTIMSLQIASLFPLNIDFELKRKFCISIIHLFVQNNTNECQLNLNEIQNFLLEINWKSLSPEDIYVIIQMIGLSLDLPKDLIDNKQTISTILGILENKINSSVPKASEFEFSEIHKLLMILKSKVNVSKRF